MKTCTTCHEPKDETSFNKLARSKDGLQPRCRDCSKEWYLSNREAHIQNASKNSKRRRKEVQAWVCSYLSEHPCVDCGEADIVVLEFDHRSTDEKFKAVSQMISDYSLIKIQAEVAKCEVRCANCHRRKTARDFGHFKHAPLA